MKKNCRKIQLAAINVLLFVFFLAFQIGYSQGLYIGSGSEFYLKKNTDFTTGNTVVTTDLSGIFSLEAGADWGSNLEYVNGEVVVYGGGETKLPLGDNGVYAPVLAEHTGNINASYFNSSPPIGSNGVDVDAVADVEYWELSGNAVITLPWNDDSDITSLVNDNGGVLSSVSIVGLNGGVWDLVSASQSNTVNGDLLNGDVKSDENNKVNLDTFSQFTFGIDHQAALAINDLFLSTGIDLLANPVKAYESTIRFKASNDLVDLKATLYDVMGKTIKFYDNIKTYNGIGVLQKPNLKSGLYFLKFDHNGKQGVKKIIIE